MKYFNIAGPCNSQEHYMIDASSRLKGVEQLIDMKQYFVIHAARQSGKTTYLKDLTERINAGGKYYALYCSLEGLQDITNPKDGIPEIVRKIKNLLSLSNISVSQHGIPKIVGKIRNLFGLSTIPHRLEFAKDADYDNFSNVLNMELTLFCRSSDKPLVILFDEADCLSEGTLISFLRQLRDGHNSRPGQAFLHSVALVGMRDIRDYKAKIRPDSESLGSASPFNIVTESLTLKNFTKEEITLLYRQHT
ncbi:MAG: ATP-binding protein, partial [Tannerella sp.]|nr:ATP-binding protein [Tannerella sp.]